MRYKLITFDVFSALCDIQGTFIPLLNEFDEFNGKDVSAFFQMWRNKQYEYLIIHNSLEREFMSFEEVTRRTLDYTLQENNIELVKKEREYLVANWSKLKFWSEAEKVVQEVRERGYLIGMLSNGDQKMLMELQTNCNIKFDFLLSAEKVGYYKPSPRIYKYAYEQADIKIEELLHVAGSTIDILGAISAGIPCAWSNRKNLAAIDPSYRPTYQFSDLTELLEHI
ncbi:haloacid dehalogenase type II [bacterium LRH843]|nr:haloacid dehalogenase type II [bacterium LRH843]